MTTKLSFIILFLCVFFCSSLNAQKLEIACDIWPPYQIKTESELSGFSVELVQKIFDELGIQIDIIDFPWKRAVKMISSGEADALFSANYTKERESFGLYPKEPLVVSSWVIWVRSDSGIEFKDYLDIDNLKAGIVRGYSYTPAFWSFLKSHKNYFEVSDDETNFKKLNVKRIDYTIAELGNGFYILKKLGLKGIKPLMQNPIKEDGLYIVFNKNKFDREFVKKFSEKLRLFKKTKEYNFLYNRYFR